MEALSDPRIFPDAAAAPGSARALYALAEAALGAETSQRADAIDRELRFALTAQLDEDAAGLAAAIDGAPSVAIARGLWRALDAAWRESTTGTASDVALGAFAIPLVIVAGVDGGGADVVVPATLAEPQRLAAILARGDALGGNRNFALADAVVAPDALEVGALPRIRAWLRLPESDPSRAPPRHGAEPAPMRARPTSESVHLRFAIGTAVAGGGSDPMADDRVGKWGVPFAREVVRQLAAPGATLLVLPRAPQRPLPALVQGRIAQREVSAQIFASNAIRKLRATLGEPTAVLSAHRAADARGGGELRLSLASPLDARSAEGFRCPLHALDRVADVAAMLVGLLRDCRVATIHVVAGVHPDRTESGVPLLFKPDALPPHVTLAPG